MTEILPWKGGAVNPGRQDEDPATGLVHLLRGLTVELDLFGAEFAHLHRLHTTDLRALIHLLDAGRAGITATPGWLGEQLGLNSASITALVDRMERLGHIRRVRDTADRRRVILVVEDQAVALGWSFFGPLIAAMVTAMTSFDEAELATVRRFLLSMSDVVAAARRSGEDSESAGSQ
jgi:DNA-binding MarR family transcriptional regulator